ncbi:unnamed protein product [Paramecium primaurelia]|uniref:Chromatin modification-related protein MEAF6 n=1 Tax=Paramecium primaurelia TaxID=5886 RepID=A0A8S1MES7_PARPR|nr:unnamed protein product [Paramecium primaurelia]
MSEKKFQELSDKRQSLENELKVLEKQIFDLETKYLEETAATGNVIKGWEGYTTIKSGKLNGNVLRKTKANANDRIFSQSSKTSPFYQITETVVEEPKSPKSPQFRPRRMKKKKHYGYKKDDVVENSQGSSSEDFQQDQVKKVKGSKKI